MIKYISLFVFGYEIQVPLLSSEGRDWVGLRSLCQILGIQHGSQYQKLQNSSKHIPLKFIPSVDRKGHPQNLVCIDVQMVGAWLYGINANKVLPENKGRLLKLQRDLQYLLSAAIRGEGVASDEGVVARSLQQLAAQVRELTRELHELKGDLVNTKNRLASSEKENMELRTRNSELEKMNKTLSGDEFEFSGVNGRLKRKPAGHIRLIS